MDGGDFTFSRDREKALFDYSIHYSRVADMRNLHFIDTEIHRFDFGIHRGQIAFAFHRTEAHRFGIDVMDRQNFGYPEKHRKSGA